MRIFLAFALFLSTYGLVEAHQPVLVPTQSQLEVIPVEQPEISRAFYGTLVGFPHTYEITSDEPFSLFVEVLVPDIDEAERAMSAIIVKEVRRGVEEIARLKGSGAGWERFYEPFGGDYYRRGASYSNEVEAGTYIVQVHTAENYGKYTLVIGETEDFEGLGYFTLLGRMIEVKRFFGKSPLMVVQSPFVYVPLGVLFILSIGYGWWRRRKRLKSSVSSPIADAQ